MQSLNVSVKTGGSYASYLAYGTFEADKFGDQKFKREGYISKPDQAPKGTKVWRKSEGKYGGAQHTYEYILEVEDDFKFFIVKVGSGKQTSGDQEILFTPNTEEKSPSVEFDSEWEVTFPDENQILICGPSKLEILIDDLDPTLAEKTQLPESEIETIGVSYWIETPTEHAKDAVVLEVVTVSDSSESKQATIHIGSQVSLEIPFDFARQLQSILLGENRNA